MDTARLAAIRAREQAASPGPWVAGRTSNSGGTLGGPVAEMYWGDGLGGDSLIVGRPRDDDLNITYNADADAAFIAAARSDVPDLLAEVERLRAGLEGLREPHTADCISHHRGLENSCTCIPDRLTIFHNARIDALLNGGHE